MSNLARVLKASAACALFAIPSLTQTGSHFVNFEGAFTNPIRLNSTGSQLYVLNTPNQTLSIYDVTSPAAPVLTAEVPVGFEPVSVNFNPVNPDEVWVVNQESDSVSVVSLSKRIVVDTLAAKDEPADVVFANGKAFVSIGRSNLINVYDAASHAFLSSIPVFGGMPRAMAVSANGSFVYAAFAMSGNQSTLIPYQFAPPTTGPPNLPKPPKQALIKPWNDPLYQSFIKYSMPDNDVVAINTFSLKIAKYFTAVGTVNLGIAVQPSTGDLFVANTDAKNLVRYEPTLCANFVTNRISKVTASNTVTAYDLNPGLSVSCNVDQNALSLALAQPTNIVFDASGQNMYVAAFGTDRIAKVDANGNVLARIEINPQETGATVAPATKRGPRGLAINNTANKLYVLNRISNTFSIVDTGSGQVLSEQPTGSKDQTPAVIKQGRGFFYDAKLSGNGSASCASCHVDGETDHLAWDLGNPNGQLQTVVDQQGDTLQLHPMKGPMTTLTMRGLVNTQPYHWRADRATFADFNGAFASLMGGNQLSTADMQSYTDFVNTIAYMPNPYQNLDRSYPTSLAGGNAVNGLNLYNTLPTTMKNNTCAFCHTLTAGTVGSNLLVRPNQPQPLKVTQLRAVYQKLLFNNDTGPTIDGFGLNSDGDTAGLFKFFTSASFPGLVGKTQEIADLTALSLAFDTGFAPTVGYARTLLASNVTSTSIVSDWATLEQQVAANNCGLIATGTIGGVITNLGYSSRGNIYIAQGSGTKYTHAQLASFVQSGDTLTIMGVPHS